MIRRNKIKLAGLAVMGFLATTGMTKPIQETKTPLFGYKVINTYPHDPKAFTQGLIHKNGYLYESTGRYGTSSIRKVELETGKVLQIQELPSSIFGEGLTDWGDTLISLTWKKQLAFMWDLDTFKSKKTFNYVGEGWGITHNDTHLIMSDGSAVLKFLDPVTKQTMREIYVTLNNKPLTNVNELEWVNGEIYANVWQTDYILRINPADGKVVGIIDLAGILESTGTKKSSGDSVLNGIAIDKDGKLFVTGKLWPKLFEIELVAK